MTFRIFFYTHFWSCNELLRLKTYTLKDQEMICKVLSILMFDGCLNVLISKENYISLGELDEFRSNACERTLTYLF